MKHAWIERLGLGKKTERPEGETSLGRDLAERLSDLPPERLRYLAAFGGLLGRVAFSDGEISAEETGRIRAILRHMSGLPEDEADLVTRLIAERAETLVGLEDHLYTREMNELCDADQKKVVLSCLFAVAAADDEISPEENAAVQTIAKALRLLPKDFVEIRSLYRDKLSVLKDLPGH